MPSEVRLEKFWIQIMKYSQIWMKKYAEWSEGKKITEKLKEGLKSSILGPQNLGSGEGSGPWVPLDLLVLFSVFCFEFAYCILFWVYQIKVKQILKKHAFDNLAITNKPVWMGCES